MCTSTLHYEEEGAMRTVTPWGGGDRCVRVPYEEEEDNVPSFKGAVFSRKRMTKMEAASGGTASSAASTASFSRAIAAPAGQEGHSERALEPRSEHDSF